MEVGSTGLGKEQFDAREFSRSVASGGSAAVKAFTDFVELANKFESVPEKNDDVVELFINFRPTADEVIQSVDVENGVVAVAAAEALAAIIRSRAGKVTPREVTGLAENGCELASAETCRTSRMTRFRGRKDGG